MSLKKLTFLSGFIIFSMVITFAVFAEEPVVAPTDATVISSDQQVAPKNISETQWAWGEVTNIDVLVKTLTLKYLDYETDQEKELILTVDEKTAFENIKSLDEVKIKDTLSVDYMVGADGKNIAKNINFEKPDSSSAATAPTIESTKPVETSAIEPVTDASQASIPVQLSAPVDAPTQMFIPAQSAVVTTEASALGSEPAAQSASTPVPAAQESQVQQ